MHWYDHSHIFANKCFLCDQNPNTHANTWRYDNPFADANRHCNSSINANNHRHKGSVTHANCHADGNCLCNAHVNRDSHTDSDSICNTNAYRNPYPFTHSHGIPYGNSNT